MSHLLQPALGLVEGQAQEPRGRQGSGTSAPFVFKVPLNGRGSQPGTYGGYP